MAIRAGSDQWCYALVGSEAARVYLSRGYTTIRDAGGNTMSLKMAIDEGSLMGRASSRPAR